ncbi:MAG: alpha/beta hydrolase [Methanobacteriota archaeon]|nr:MAG: alpha/beta hydrolase [Euryarchaeota archaeon]
MNDSEITESQKKGAKVFYRLPKWLSISVKLLNLISTKLTTRFLWNVFTKPLDFRMRDVEKKFYKEHKSIDFFSESAKKTVKIYRIKGKGPKILFVHGWSSRASKFHKIIGEFKSKNFDITAVDMPAHGQSLSKRSHLPEFCDVVYDLSNNNGPYDTIIGHSMGAVAALNAANMGQKFKNIILISPAAYRIEAIFRNFVSLFGLSEDFYVKSMFDSFEAKDGRKPPNYGPDKFATDIESRCLIIHSEDDAQASPKVAEKIHQDIKNSKLMMATNLGHMRTLTDEKVIETMGEFIS